MSKEKKKILKALLKTLMVLIITTIFVTIFMHIPYLFVQIVVSIGIIEIFINFYNKEE